MTPASALIERLVPAAEHSSGEPGREWFERNGLPDPRSEAWRSMPLDDIVSTLTSAAPSELRSADRAVVDELAGRHGGIRLVLVNGRFDAALSDAVADGSGLWCAPATGATGPPTDQVAVRRDPPDGFEALNRASGTDVTIRNAPATGPLTVHLAHLTIPGPGVEVSHPRAVIEVAPHSHLVVIETFDGLAGMTITNAHTDLVLGEGAQVDHVRVQNEPVGALHLGRTQVRQSAESRLRSTSVMLGARIARHTLDVHLGGAGARADLDGIYAPTGSQRHDLSIGVDHAASSCGSTQRYYGVADDHGHGSFGGRIVVRPDTVKTDAHQLNRNLVLATTAQADTRPWLEILADDVRCTHGATVGQLDDDALFYLRSRGIPYDRARALLIEGFTSEIVDAIRPDTLRAQVYAALGAREKRA